MSSDPTSAEAAIRALEAAYDAAWQQGDLEALMACFAEDAVVINPHGQEASGRVAIRQMLGEFLAGPAQGSQHTSVIVRVAFITAEVAIVDGRAFLDHLAVDDDSTPPSLIHRFTDVVVKRNGTWVIAHVRACSPEVVRPAQSDLDDQAAA